MYYEWKNMIATGPGDWSIAFAFVSAASYMYTVTFSLKQKRWTFVSATKVSMTCIYIIVMSVLSSVLAFFSYLLNLASADVPINLGRGILHMYLVHTCLASSPGPFLVWKEPGLEANTCPAAVPWITIAIFDRNLSSDVSEARGSGHHSLRMARASGLAKTREHCYSISDLSSSTEPNCPYTNVLFIERNLL